VLLEAKERGGLREHEDRRRIFARGDSAHDKTVIGEVLAYGLLDELRLLLPEAVAACSSRRVSSAPRRTYSGIRSWPI
jgi:hypothetical protein